LSAFDQLKNPPHLESVVEVNRDEAEVWGRRRRGVDEKQNAIDARKHRRSAVAFGDQDQGRATLALALILSIIRMADRSTRILFSKMSALSRCPAARRMPRIISSEPTPPLAISTSLCEAASDRATPDDTPQTSCCSFVFDISAPAHD
jgi:hypothetical protein